MLDEMGRIEFQGEVLSLVERLWQSYQEAEGPPKERAARLAGLAYVVAALRQDVEALWDQIQADPELQDVDLERLVAEALGPLDEERRAAFRARLERRGLLD